MFPTHDYIKQDKYAVSVGDIRTGMYREVKDSVSPRAKPSASGSPQLSMFLVPQFRRYAHYCPGPPFTKTKRRIPKHQKASSTPTINKGHDCGNSTA